MSCAPWRGGEYRGDLAWALQRRLTIGVERGTPKYVRHGADIFSPSEILPIGGYSMLRRRFRCRLYVHWFLMRIGLRNGMYGVQ